MKKLFQIQHDMLDSQTLVVVGHTDEEIVAWVTKNTVVEVTPEFAELIKCSGFARTVSVGAFTMIRLKDWEPSADAYSYLAHEAFHLAEFHMDRIGVEHDVEVSGEVFAYHIQWTVKQIVRELNSEA